VAEDCASAVAFHILKTPRGECGEARRKPLIDAKDKIVSCSVCGNITEQGSVFYLHADSQRDKTVEVAVVGGSPKM